MFTHSNQKTMRKFKSSFLVPTAVFWDRSIISWVVTSNSFEQKEKRMMFVMLLFVANVLLFLALPFIWMMKSIE
jgi:hypothetical protein